MKTTNVVKIIIVVLMTCSIQWAKAQVTLELNSPTTNNEYVGWDTNTAIDLQIRHDGNKNIQFHTNGAERMRIASTGRVGIGTTNPGSGILTIENTSTSLGVEVGVVITTIATTGGNVGSLATVNNGVALNTGFWSTAGDFSDVGVNRGVLGDSNTSTNGTSYGVEGTAETNGEDGDVIGVRGYATAPADSSLCGNFVVGVWGSHSPGIVSNSQCNNQPWAGFFVGDVGATGTFQGGVSDQMLKQNIETFDNALELLGALAPKTYEYRRAEFPMLNLPVGTRHGIIAQELEEVMPELVKTATFPSQYDEYGNLLSEAFSFKSVNYLELIPVLIKGVQEQQSMIEEQRRQIADLASLVASCCAQSPDQRSGDTSPANDIQLAAPAGKQSALDQNFPNPFTDATSIRFSLANDCHTRVCIYNSAGQQIDCLVNESRSAGEHQVDWDTTGLAPGIYFYSLQCDGFEQVRRAVKF